MALAMGTFFSRAAVFCISAAFATAVIPLTLHAQLVRESTSPPPQQADTSGTQTPAGKKRVSQEVQLTGDDSWIDTGIDVQPGEHVVITTTGSLRYSDANQDNGPGGLARGF